MIVGVASCIGLLGGSDTKEVGSNSIPMLYMSQLMRQM